MKGSGSMTPSREEGSLFSAKEIFMMASGRIVCLKGMAYMSVEIPFGDMKATGKVEFKMEKENKYLKIAPITKATFKKGSGMEKEYLRTTMEDFMRAHF
jgi:hypothetical protein